MNKIDINKSVPSERWLEFFDQFSDGNRGRHISIEILDSALAIAYRQVQADAVRTALPNR